MWRTWVTVMLLVGVMGLLAPLADASPIDPTWVPGLWDNGDYDDVISVVTSTLGVVHAAGFRDLPRLTTVAPQAAWPLGPVGDARFLTRDRTRAPPLAALPLA